MAILLSLILENNENINEHIFFIFINAVNIRPKVPCMWIVEAEAGGGSVRWGGLILVSVLSYPNG